MRPNKQIRWARLRVSARRLRGPALVYALAWAALLSVCFSEALAVYWLRERDYEASCEMAGNDEASCEMGDWDGCCDV